MGVFYMFAHANVGLLKMKQSNPQKPESRKMNKQ